MDGNTPRPKIRACCISDPFVIIFREDDSIGMFIEVVDKGRIRRKDMSPMGDKVFYVSSAQEHRADVGADVQIPHGMFLY